MSTDLSPAQYSHQLYRPVLVAALGGLLAISGCRSDTEYGKCIGAGDERDPSLTYEVSTRNVVLGVVFIETIFAPLLVVLSELHCPIGHKAVRP